jgi:hypothetical protein
MQATKPAPREDERAEGWDRKHNDGRGKCGGATRPASLQSVGQDEAPFAPHLGPFMRFVAQ